MRHTTCEAIFQGRTNVGFLDVDEITMRRETCFCGGSTGVVEAKKTKAKRQQSIKQQMPDIDVGASSSIA